MALVKCNCEHAYQSKKYAKNIRVGNPVREAGGEGKPKPSKTKARCTSCGKERPIVRQ